MGRVGVGGGRGAKVGTGGDEYLNLIQHEGVQRRGVVGRGEGEREGEEKGGGDWWLHKMT